MIFLDLVNLMNVNGMILWFFLWWFNCNYFLRLPLRLMFFLPQLDTYRPWYCDTEFLKYLRSNWIYGFLGICLKKLTLTLILSCENFNWKNLSVAFKYLTLTCHTLTLFLMFFRKKLKPRFSLRLVDLSSQSVITTIKKILSSPYHCLNIF